MMQLTNKVRILVGLEESGYQGLVLAKLTESKAAIGDTIEISNNGVLHTGILMPRSQIGSDPDHVVVKIRSGYNIGIRIPPGAIIKRIRGPTKPQKSREELPSPVSGLPTVSILSTGGTIASKVDYRTGAVNPALSAKDLYDTVPELRNHATIRAKILLSKLSENLLTKDWSTIARRIASEIRKGADGVVVAHGTDTLAFTAAALSFALQELPVPVVLVGSQRSSDRPSSDAAMNLIGATDLAGRADVAEVMVVMHGETGDSHLLAHRGNRVRKLHTSRRDAFKSVNSSPLFRIQNSVITELSEPLLRRDKDRKIRVKSKFEEQVALLKTFIGMDGSIIENLVNEEYRGIILEGTGLGHVPESIQPSLKKAIGAGVIVAMTSQCIFGRVDMNVYRTGVELLNLGVLPCENMLPETALVKMMWAIANTRSIEKAKNLLLTPLSGEFDMRTEYSEYPIAESE
jgi:glutamyl-tRNA(Gln) amidotransferase subunit D